MSSSNVVLRFMSSRKRSTLDSGLRSANFCSYVPCASQAVWLPEAHIPFPDSLSSFLFLSHACTKKNRIKEKKKRLFPDTNVVGGMALMFPIHYLSLICGFNFFTNCPKLSIFNELLGTVRFSGHELNIGFFRYRTHEKRRKKY